MRLTGAFMTLWALVACSQGQQASLATPVLSYNGSHPFPAVIAARLSRYGSRGDNNAGERAEPN
jgi:hypothetical protein